MKESFHSELPQSDFLKKYIAYYYFHNSGDDTEALSFMYYPHFKNALTVYKNSKLSFKAPFSTQARPEDCGYSMGYSRLIKNAAKTAIDPPFTKIGIVFQPLGLNHFLSKNLINVLPNPITLDFNYFGAPFETVLNKVHDSPKMSDKSALLDEFFTSIYKGFSEVKLENAVNILVNSTKKYTVELLADEVQVSRKTLLRLFRKHLNCTVIEYINLVQFRKAVEVFQGAIQKSSLTKLAHQTDYYDQSEFINHFKKLTGFNPKAFFNNLSKFGSQGTYWTSD